jgi:3-deoxy-D-manno-octulosonic-acid transferase
MACKSWLPFSCSIQINFLSYLFLGFEGSGLNLEVCHDTETWLMLMTEKYRHVFLYVVDRRLAQKRHSRNSSRFKLIAPKVKQHTQVVEERETIINPSKMK